MVAEFIRNGSELWYQDEDGMHRMDENSPMVTFINERVADFYPEADKALMGCYSKSSHNVTYYNYLRARRFCKCNFGVLDHTEEDIIGDRFNCSRVPCHLRGECKYEDVICMPKIETNLSDGEKRVMKLVCEGRSNDEIAEELYLSPNTVKRHISNSFIKWGVKSRGEFMKRANDNNIFV